MLVQPIFGLRITLPSVHSVHCVQEMQASVHQGSQTKPFRFRSGDPRLGCIAYLTGTCCLCLCRFTDSKEGCLLPHTCVASSSVSCVCPLLCPLQQTYGLVSMLCWLLYKHTTGTLLGLTVWHTPVLWIHFIHCMHAALLRGRRAVGLLYLVTRHLPGPLKAVDPLVVQAASMHCTAAQKGAM